VRQTGALECNLSVVVPDRDILLVGADDQDAGPEGPPFADFLRVVRDEGPVLLAPGAEQRVGQHSRSTALRILGLEADNSSELHALVGSSVRHHGSKVEILDMSSRPLFGDPLTQPGEPDELGFMIGGMAHFDDPAELARAYKLAADSLIDYSDLTWQVAFPILYLYRHSLELYLKAIVRPVRRTHNLAVLLDQFVDYVKAHHDELVPSPFRRYVREMARFDPEAQSFRYTDAEPSLRFGEEGWVELSHLRTVMNQLARGFEAVLAASSALRRSGNS
jgi:hypothetical protein